MEQLLKVSDPIQSATLRGAALALDFILTGGLDASARDLLGLPTSPPTPPAPYMASRETLRAVDGGR